MLSRLLNKKQKREHGCFGPAQHRFARKTRIYTDKKLMKSLNEIAFLIREYPFFPRHPRAEPFWFWLRQVKFV